MRLPARMVGEVSLDTRALPLLPTASARGWRVPTRGSNEARFESRACFAAGNVKKSPAEAGLFTLGAYTSVVKLDAQSQTWMRGLYQMPRYPSQTGAPRVQ